MSGHKKYSVLISYVEFSSLDRISFAAARKLHEKLVYLHKNKILQVYKPPCYIVNYPNTY